MARRWFARFNGAVRPTVLLWDIDGTLISTAGAGRRAFERTFTRRYGTADPIAFSFGGMTDRAIARDGLRALRGEEPSEAEIDALLAEYLDVLAEEAAATPFRVHPGVIPCLDASRDRPATAVGLGTGNLRAGARIKLERVGIYDRFAFGGFGCDHIHRPSLVRIGADRGAALLGQPLAGCRVVVIGDTEKDVAAAQAIGAESIAVATGACSLDALRASGPTHLFADLADPRALSAVLEG